MKRKLYFAACAAVALAACNEPLLTESEKASELVDINFSLYGGETKVTGTNDENYIYNFQIFVFDSKNVIEAYNHKKFVNQIPLSTASTSVQCTPGTKTIVAIVNALEMPDVKSLDDLNSRTSYLSDNDVRKFHMSGLVSKEITAACDISIPVSRLAARIKIASVTNKMSVDYYKEMSFAISDMYLINVVGSTGYLSEKEPELWYNMMKSGNNGSLCFMLERNNSTSVMVKNEDTVNMESEHAYYTYPNSTETDSTDETWCARYTRFVLEARLGNELYYYPVSIPNIERNTAYEIHLTVTRPGSSSPDIPVDVETASITVNVVDWIDGEDIHETI